MLAVNFFVKINKYYIRSIYAIYGGGKNFSFGSIPEVGEKQKVEKKTKKKEEQEKKRKKG